MVVLAAQITPLLYKEVLHECTSEKLSLDPSTERILGSDCHLLAHRGYISRHCMSVLPICPRHHVIHWLLTTLYLLLRTAFFIYIPNTPTLLTYGDLGTC